MLPLTRTAPLPPAVEEREPAQEAPAAAAPPPVAPVQRPAAPSYSAVPPPAPTRVTLASALTPRPPQPSFEAEAEFVPAPVVQPPVRQESVVHMNPRAPAQRPAARAPAAAAFDPQDFVRQAPVHIEPPVRSAPVPPQPEAREEALISVNAGATVTSAFETLATSMFLQNSGMVEDATRELLRPLLKQWLDDNLPVLVERLVRIEIERVARGGR